MATKLTKEEIKAIQEYGNKIDDDMEAVRRLPGMYIGRIGTQGFVNMCREIYQNSIDQILMPDSPGNWFSFFLDERNLQVIVEDNGLALPYDSMVKILTNMHTSKNYNKKPGEYSTGVHGSGAKCVNALSISFTVQAFHYDGTAIEASFSRGKLIDGPKKIPNKEKKQGSRISFIPDLDILGEVRPHWKNIYRLIKNTISLCPIGTHMDLRIIDSKGIEHVEHIKNEDGIIAPLISTVYRPLIKPIIIGNDDGTRKTNIAFTFDGGGEEGPNPNPLIVSFCNLSPTIGGKDVDGTLDAIARWFSTYMNNVYLANQKSKDKIKVTVNDIKMGLVVVISSAHLDPVLVGQSKEMIGNADLLDFCKDTVMRGLDEWSKTNPQDLAKISKFFKDMAELRIKNDKSKAKIVNKYKSNAITGLPQKYVRPLGKKNIELIIVEGDE